MSRNLVAVPLDDSTGIAEALRQGDCATSRRRAIASFGKALRRGDTFQPTWDAVGGAAELARLMAEFSVRDVRAICRRLGRTASAEKARPERRAALSELVRLLYDGQLDDRPLRVFYQIIVPACTLDVVQEWERDRNVEWTSSQHRALSRGHRERQEKRFLGEVFSPDANSLKFKTEKGIFNGNLPFCEEILLTLVAKEGEIRVPPDFMDEFAMPLLMRLLSKDFDNETRDKFLNYVVQCLRKHKSHLADQLHTGKSGLIQYVVKRWDGAPPDRKQQMKVRLEQLLELLPTKNRPLNLASIHQLIRVPRSLNSEAGYELLQLIFRHVEGYGISFEDDSVSGIAQLRNLPVENDRWPAKLFFSIDVENARKLLEKLAQAYPRGDFLSIESDSSARSVLQQTRGLYEFGRGDVEIVRCLLARRSKTGAEDLAWLDRARVVVEERRKKAQQASESKDRAFWAKSALSLSIASGDYEIFGDTVLWSRRFNKDWPTFKELYSADTMGTEEAEDLLCALPQRYTPAAAATTTALVQRNIELANRILINLIEITVTTVQEPGFEHFEWHSLLRLPMAITDRRIKNADPFDFMVKSSFPEDRAFEITGALWKPMVDVLIEVEALLADPMVRALLKIWSNVEVSGTYILRRLPKSSAQILAELTGFLIERMRARLGPERLRLQMGTIVGIVLRFADGPQPWLACPFIRDLVMDGDTNSLWHRKLINSRYISTLPPKLAREFVRTLAGAMRDKLREQNSRPVGDNEGKAQVSAIKVVTIKAMARVLQNNRLMDAFSSCDILTSLLAEARHVDAKIAIVSSLISTLEIPFYPPELRARILDALGSYVVPVVAQLSERRPFTEADWAIATDREEVLLPDVSEDTPLMKKLVAQARNSKLNPDDKVRISQLIVSALEQSAVNNSRWMNLFLAKNNFTLEAEERLPVGPVNTDMLVSFFDDWTGYMPASLFRMMCDIVICNINPSPGIARVTEAVKANQDLANSNAGKHWLKQFDTSDYDVLGLGLRHAAFALQRPAKKMNSKSENAERITIPMMQDFMLSAAEQFASMGDVRMLNILLSRLCENRFNGSENWKSWRANCIPVAKEIIAMFEAIRSDKKDRGAAATDRTRTPQALPNMFRLSVTVLPIPYSSTGQARSAEDDDDFISELSGLIEQLADRRGPYHRDFAYLKKELLEACGKPDLVVYALKLGQTQNIISAQEPTLSDYLRLELAGDLLIGVGEPIAGLANDAQEMLRSWKHSQIEGIMAIGVSVEQELEDNEGMRLMEYEERKMREYEDGSLSGYD